MTLPLKEIPKELPLTVEVKVDTRKEETKKVASSFLPLINVSIPRKKNRLFYVLRDTFIIKSATENPLEFMVNGQSYTRPSYLNILIRTLNQHTRTFNLNYQLYLLKEVNFTLSEISQVKGIESDLTWLIRYLWESYQVLAKKEIKFIFVKKDAS